MSEQNNKQREQQEHISLPTDTPELEDVALGARAIAALTNRLYGSF